MERIIIKDRKKESNNSVAVPTEIVGITKEKIGQRFIIKGRVENIVQTSGPTLFMLFDGTASITAKAFIKAGERAYQEINKTDVMEATVEIREHNNELEAEIHSCKKSLAQDFNQLVLERVNRLAKPENPEFMIKSDILEKLRPKFLNAAFEIKKAIMEKRPIIVRHHADCDGYCAGIALERAILPLVQEHNDERDAWRLYKRAPSKAPFYEYMDVTKDLAFALEDMEKFGLKEPVIILADNGSTHEDVLAIKKLSIYGCKVIVIDHHYPGDVADEKSEVDEFVIAHVNPYLVGGDSNLCAGMLCTEIARFIHKESDNIKFLPGLAGTSDRCKGSEYEQYLKIAEDKGYTLEQLRNTAECVDFEAHYLRFVESRSLVNDLLGRDRDKQKDLIDLLIKDINKRKEQQLIVAKHYCKVEQIGSIKIVEVDAARITNRGDYPAVGKTVGMLHDSFNDKRVITLGLGEDFITIRIGDEINANINKIVEHLQKEKPHTFAEGGGHEHAGTIKFVPAAFSEIVNFTKEEIKKSNN
ncbi:hypothetical protein JXM83_07290 [Candidatus Woesearchaeota archaeon]|nr:hypothetical protein [Candidatus Woesearchaeota archaeon]